MTNLRESILGRLEAAEVYQQHLSEERHKERADHTTERRLTADAGAAIKFAEVAALVRIGDLLESVLTELANKGDGRERVELTYDEARRYGL